MPKEKISVGPLDNKTREYRNSPPGQAFVLDEMFMMAPLSGGYRLLLFVMWHSQPVLCMSTGVPISYASLPVVSSLSGPYERPHLVS